MPAPVYSQSNGVNFVAVANVDVPLPATVMDGEIAFMMALISNVNDTITWPDGWTQVGSVETQGSDFTNAVAWKRLIVGDGGTSPNVQFGSGNATGSCRVHCFTGVQRFGPPHEAHAVAKGTSTSMSTSAITTLGTDRLVAVLSGLDTTTARSSGYTGYTQQMTGNANNTRRYVDDQTIATAQTVAAQSCWSPADDWVTWTLSLLPQVSRARVVVVA